MPELPEVETVVRQLRPHLVGSTIQGVALASSQMAKSDLGPYDASLSGRRFEALDRHGKWMFLRLDSEAILVLHLGMTGWLGIEPANAPVEKHTHLRLLLEGGKEELRFTDARRFGRILLCGKEGHSSRFGPEKLGPDALRLTAKQTRRALAGTRRRIKAVLLDQRTIAGIGNIYADEILHICRVHPARIADTIEDSATLARAIRSVLGRAVRSQGTTIRDYVTAQGVPGGFQQQLKVYGRANLPCRRCKTAIALCRRIVAGRATYWCPYCQGESDRSPPP